MASMSPDRSGGWMIQFTDAAKKRRTLRLGKLPKKTAESVRARVEQLHAAAVAGVAWDADLAGWVRSVGADLARKLALVGLVPKRESQTLGAFFAAYLAGRREDGTKGSSVRVIAQACADLLAFFGAGADLRAVTPARAEEFRRHYAARKLAGSTVHRRLKNSRRLFQAAAERGLVDADPFAAVKPPPLVPDPDRQVYVPRDDVRRVLDHCPPDWRITAALARFAGLRAPSEAFSLRVADVDLKAGRMVVRSPKTEHHAGGASRITPVFPDLRPYLEEALARAAGSEYVVGGVGERGRARAASHPDGWSAVGLSDHFGTFIRRAGLKVWPKAVHNLRASCETDLAAAHPIHVVCAWLGNTPKVALQHYLQTLDGDFAKALAAAPTGGPGAGAADRAAPALQNALPSPTVTGGHGPSPRGETPEIPVQTPSPAVTGCQGPASAGVPAELVGADRAHRPAPPGGRPAGRVLGRRRRRRPDARRRRLVGAQRVPRLPRPATRLVRGDRRRAGGGRDPRGAGMTNAPPTTEGRRGRARRRSR